MNNGHDHRGQKSPSSITEWGAMALVAVTVVLAMLIVLMLVVGGLIRAWDWALQ